MSCVIKHIYDIFLCENCHPSSYFGLSPGHINYIAICISWVKKHPYHTFLIDSQNYKSLGAVDHLMYYLPRGRPRAIAHQVVHSTSGMIDLAVAQKGTKSLYISTVRMCKVQNTSPELKIIQLQNIYIHA